MAEGRATLLVAEDDAEIRNLLRDRLEGAGYVVRLARDGAEAVGMLRATAVSGMLLDINMPQVDGFGVLAERGAIPGFPPVLVLTARHASGDVQRAIAAGARDYLTKPFTGAQLLLRVRRLLRSARDVAPPPAHAHMI